MDYLIEIRRNILYLILYRALETKYDNKMMMKIIAAKNLISHFYSEFKYQSLSADFRVKEVKTLAVFVNLNKTLIFLNNPLS